ncbi:MAG: hypothetical protein MJ247_07240 [Alphaproteobacteria bacterium]|nr:hypothetical protein [Alphaproteobacteria bacterium]
MKKIFLIFFVLCFTSLDVSAKICKLGKDCDFEKESSKAKPKNCPTEACDPGDVCYEPSHRCVSPCDARVFNKICSGNAPTCIVISGVPRCGCDKDEQCTGENKHCLDVRNECVGCTNKSHCKINEICNTSTYKCEPIKCEVENCAKCIDNDQNKCEICNEGFILENGVCKGCNIAELSSMFANGECKECKYYDNMPRCSNAECLPGFTFDAEIGLCKALLCEGDDAYVKGVGCTSKYCEALNIVEGSECANGTDIKLYWKNNKEKHTCCCQPAN